jgi:hypothetical protein
VLFVGINPAADLPGPTKRNSTMHRLHRWVEALGIDFFSFVNCYHRAGTDHKIAHVDWDFLREVASQGFDTVVALGGFPSRVLTKLGIAHVTMPHPSPRNRVWNDPEAESRHLDRVRAAIHGE